MQQRIIKFRARDINRNFYLFEKEGVTLKEIHNLLDIANLEFEQFTGLLDKNGKEIYEGDVLRWYDGVTHSVRWDAQDAGFAGIGLPAEWPGDTEVIGNIHENPELLK